MEWFDTHAHPHDTALLDDADGVVARAADAGVTRILCIGTRTKLKGRLNSYLIIFAILTLLCSVGVVILWRISQGEQSARNSGSVTLSPDTIRQIIQSNPRVGDNQQTLTVAADSIFDGSVLVKRDLDIAGSVRLGNDLTLPNLVVGGTTNVNNLETGGRLGVANGATIRNSLSVEGTLSVSGGGNFGGPLTAGQLTVTQLVLSQDLTLNRHIVTSGSQPAISSGGSVGSGGTVSLSGTDTAGTITVNSGSSPSSGVLANVTFAASYAQAPRVVASPVTAAAANANIYVSRTANGFTVHAAAVPAGSSQLQIDYIVIQ